MGVIDSDQHLYEYRGLWEEHIEPSMRDAENLAATVGKGNQILLQRFDTERVRDLEFFQFAIAGVGVNEKFAVSNRKFVINPGVLKVRAVEIADNCVIGRWLHGEIMLRFVPLRELRFMATLARFTADVGRRQDRKRFGGRRLFGRARDQHEARQP